MKIDVMMTSQTCGEDDPKSPSPSPPSPPSLTSRQEDSKARQRRWAAVSECRLAEQVEAEKVLLSSDINGLKNQGDWKAGRGGGGEHLGEEDVCHGNKLGAGDELFWTNASDDDTGNIGGVASAEDFHTVHDGSLLVHSRNVAASVVGIPRYLVGGGPRVSCTPPSPGEEKRLDGSPMEADITEFFPAVRRAATSLEASAKKQGMSPRQRLLYRYRMEEMLMTQENNEEEEDMTGDISGEDMTGDISGDGSALLSLSSSFEPTTSSVAGAGLEAESSTGFAQSSPGSPYSWNASASGSVGGHPDCSLDESSGRGFLSAGGLLRDCHICGYAPCSRDDYDSHMKRTHFTHKCHLCVYWSRSPGRLNRHMKTFHGEPNTADAPANRKPKNPRKYACKQCDFFTYIQEEIWNHTRVHVPASKLLSCPHCPFVCAFKHHMQYHVNNHLGHKPFRCSDCNYRCNNKSMLNSHRKSHSNDYPYRCGVCNYAAKYRHALNIHLRKKRHFADGEVVLEDGARYIGARSRNRGGCTMATTSRDSRTSSSERRRRSSPREEEEEEEEEIVGQHDLAWRQESQHDGGRGMTDCNDVVVKQEPGTVNNSVGASYLQAVRRNHAMYGLGDGAVRPASLVSISDLSNVQLMRYSPVVYPPRTTTTTTTVAARNGVVPPPPGRYNATPRGTASIPGVSGSSVLSSSGDLDHSSLYETATIRLPVRGLSSSPGRRFPVRVGGANYRTVDTGLEQDPPSTPGRHPFDALQDCGGRGEPSGGGGKAEWPLDLTSKPSRNTASTENSNNNNNNNNNNHRNSWRSLPERVPRPCRYECQHCGIIFPDLSLYSMHMEYHDHPDPFRCNLCGQRTNDRREFFNHINQVAHKSAI